MHLSIGVLISLLFYNRIVFPRGSYLSEQISLQEESLLQKFILEMIRHDAKVHPRQAVAVVASNDQLHEMTSILEYVPHFIGNDLEKICISPEFTEDTLVLYFLKSLKMEHITEALRSLVACHKPRHARLILEGLVVNDADIELVLRIAFERFARLPVVLYPRKKSVMVYGYEIGANYSRKTALLVDWVPGVDLKKIDDFFLSSSYERCVSVSAMHRPPWVFLAKDENGVTKIKGGIEGRLLLTIAEKLGLILHVEEFNSPVNHTGVRTEAKVASCVTGKTDICINTIRPSGRVSDVVDTSKIYGQECVVWCVPRITHRESTIMTIEFSWSTWLLIGLTFFVCFAIEIVIRNKRYLNRGNTNRMGGCRIILDLIGTTLGNPIVYQPLSTGGKLLLIVYLFYSTVITTAYKTSLSSMMTVENREFAIVNVEEIIKANLTTGGDASSLEILEDQVGENEFVPELIRRFEIEPNISKALLRISNDKDFAYLILGTDLVYHQRLLEKDGVHVSLHVINECMVVHGMVMAFQKSSHLVNPINEIVPQLAGGGVLELWNRYTSLKLKEVSFGLPISSQMANTDGRLNRVPTPDKFHYILVVYCIALAFSIFIFLCELVVHKFKSSGRVRPIKNSKRVRFRSLPH